MEGAVIGHADQGVDLTGEELGVEQYPFALVQKTQVVVLACVACDLDKEGLCRQKVVIRCLTVEASIVRLNWLAKMDVLKERDRRLTVKLDLGHAINVLSKVGLDEIEASILVLNKKKSVRYGKQSDLVVDREPLLDRLQVTRDLVELV